MKKYHLIFTVIIVFFAACTKDIAVKVPYTPPKIALNCSTEVGEPIQVDISRSISLADYNKGVSTHLSNVTVVLTANDGHSETLTYDPLVDKYVAKQVAQTGATYSIIASAPTFANATASTAVPVKISITNLVHTLNARKNSDGNDQDALQLSFTDPSTTGDYYIIKLFAPMDSFYSSSSSFCVNSGDASIESTDNSDLDVNSCLSSNGIFVRDALFNGRDKELKLYANSQYLQPSFNGTDTLYPYIELYHVTEAYFRYLKSYEVYNNTKDNPFAEPVNVYSNVSNGYGIFSIIAKDMKYIK